MARVEDSANSSTLETTEKRGRLSLFSPPPSSTFTLQSLYGMEEGRIYMKNNVPPDLLIFFNVLSRNQYLPFMFLHLYLAMTVSGSGKKFPDQVKKIRIRPHPC